MHIAILLVLGTWEKAGGHLHKYYEAAVLFGVSNKNLARKTFFSLFLVLLVEWF